MGPNPLPIEPLSRKISGDDLEKSSELVQPRRCGCWPLDMYVADLAAVRSILACVLKLRRLCVARRRSPRGVSHPSSVLPIPIPHVTQTFHPPSFHLPSSFSPHQVTSETSGEHPRYHYSGRAAAEVADLKRSLTARHLALIALASGIGTGLFLGSGSALATAGPLGLLLGYVSKGSRETEVSVKLKLTLLSHALSFPHQAVMGFFTALIAFMSAETAAFLPISGG